MDFEFVSISDGKELVAKAANLLFKKYYVDGDSEKPFFTETHLTDALKTLGLFISFFRSFCAYGKYITTSWFFKTWFSIRCRRARSRSFINLWARKVPPWLSSMANSLYRDGVSLLIPFIF